MVNLSRPLDEHLGLEFGTVGFLIVLHTFHEVNVRPLSPSTEYLAHLRASQRVCGIARDSVLSQLEFDKISPGSESSHHQSAMYSLVEEFLH
jgi:hypothetical protein